MTNQRASLFRKTNTNFDELNQLHELFIQKENSCNWFNSSKFVLKRLRLRLQYTSYLTNPMNPHTRRLCFIFPTKSVFWQIGLF
jgi:hypothetical protein